MSIDKIKETFELRTQKTAVGIHEFENVPNNRVFKIETDSRPYIFKIYAKRDWPEDGKLPFVAERLRERGIPFADIVSFCRDDDNFPNGYLIENCLPGTTADRLTPPAEELSSIFGRLGVLVSAIHKIKLNGFGYIGDSGVGIWPTFSEFVFDTFHEFSESLAKQGMLGEAEIEETGEVLRDKLKACDALPPALNHGDLSAKNVMVDSGGITLIDWDDAMTLPYVADAGRMTLWLKMSYDAETARACRESFIGGYGTDFDKDAFEGCEDALHAYYGLDMLSYYGNAPISEIIRPLTQYALERCGMDAGNLRRRTK